MTVKIEFNILYLYIISSSCHKYIVYNTPMFMYLLAQHTVFESNFSIFGEHVTTHCPDLCTLYRRWWWGGTNNNHGENPRGSSRELISRRSREHFLWSRQIPGVRGGYSKINFRAVEIIFTAPSWGHSGGGIPRRFVVPCS